MCPGLEAPVSVNERKRQASHRSFPPKIIIAKKAKNLLPPVVVSAPGTNTPIQKRRGVIGLSGACRRRWNCIGVAQGEWVSLCNKSDSEERKVAGPHLEVLRDPRALLWIVRRVFDARIPPRRVVADHHLARQLRPLLAA